MSPRREAVPRHATAGQALVAVLVSVALLGLGASAILQWSAEMLRAARHQARQAAALRELQRWLEGGADAMQAAATQTAAALPAAALPAAAQPDASEATLILEGARCILDATAAVADPHGDPPHGPPLRLAVRCPDPWGRMREVRAWGDAAPRARAY